MLTSKNEIPLAVENITRAKEGPIDPACSISLLLTIWLQNQGINCHDADLFIPEYSGFDIMADILLTIFSNIFF